MREPSLLCRPGLTTAHDPDLTQKLKPALLLATVPDAVEKMGLFGRWWCDTQTGQWVLSTGAAGLLDVDAGFHCTENSCFEQVVPEDVLPLLADLRALREPGHAMPSSVSFASSMNLTVYAGCACCPCRKSNPCKRFRPAS